MAETKITKQTPYALALVICDAIWRDPGTGKQTLLGLFSMLGAAHFPVVHPQLCFYVAMTDGRGAGMLKIRLIDAEEEDEPVVEVDAPYEFEDPRVVVELDGTLAGLRFNKPGEYRLQLFADGEPLMERRVMVVSTGAQP